MSIENQDWISITDEQSTIELGTQLSHYLSEHYPDGAVIFLRGELGAGKTTLARAMLRAFGYEGPVKSPTYTLVERYQTNHFEVAHYDLYRLADPDEMEFLGVRDDFSKGILTLVEWPERAQGYFAKPDLVVSIQINHIKKGSQVVKITRQIKFNWQNNAI